MRVIVFALGWLNPKKICRLLKKYRIASIGVKSDWKDGLRTAVYETRLACPEQGPRVRMCERCAPLINGRAIHSTGTCYFNISYPKLFHLFKSAIVLSPPISFSNSAYV